MKTLPGGIFRHRKGKCRGPDSRARLRTSARNRLTIKTYKPIASVAALTAQPLAALPPYGCGMPLAGTQSIPAISKPQFGTKSLADRSCN